MKIVKNIDKKDVIDNLMKGIEVYSFNPMDNRVLDLHYEYMMTVIGIIENDDIATFTVIDGGGVK